MYVVDDDDHQFSITSLPGGGVALQQYDLPRPLKGIKLLVREDISVLLVERQWQMLARVFYSYFIFLCDSISKQLASIYIQIFITSL